MVSILVFEGSARNGCAQNRRKFGGSLKAGGSWGGGCLPREMGEGGNFYYFSGSRRASFFNLTNILNGIKYQCRLIYETGMLQK